MDAAVEEVIISFCDVRRVQEKVKTSLVKEIKRNQNMNMIYH